MRTLLAVFAESDLALVPWAERMARRLGSEDLGLLCVSEGPVPQVAEVSKPSEQHSDLAQQAGREFVDPEATGVTVFDCRAPRLSSGVLAAILDLGVGQLILPANLENRPGKETNALQRLVNVAPVDVLLLDVGGVAPGPRRVVIGQHGGGGALAIRFAARALGDTLETIVAVADAQALPRSQRVFNKGRERLPEDRRERARQVVHDEPIAASLQRETAHGDLVLVQAERTGETRQLLKSLAELRANRPNVSLAFGVIRSDEVAGPGRLERTIERIRSHLPRLDRQQRRDIHDLLERGGRMSANFVVMLMLSTAIASLGLIQSSTAVVVGAMLVAPLMTPIIALGMALVQANPSLFRAALHATVIGTGAALFTAMLLGTLSPWADLSSEIVARGAPNPFDLGIAFLSGVAGSYAMARPGGVGALVGVAIAVALVPPLASVGIALVKSEYGIAFGAGVLFLTNLLAIVAGSAIVFRLFGVDTQGRNVPRWARVATIAIAVGLLPVVAVLVQNLQYQVQSGVQRAYARPLPPLAREAIKDRVAESPGVDIVLMAQSAIEHGFGVELALSCSGQVDPVLANDLQTIIEEHLGESTTARILWLRAAEAR